MTTAKQFARNCIVWGKKHVKPQQDRQKETLDYLEQVEFSGLLLQKDMANEYYAGDVFDSIFGAVISDIGSNIAAYMIHETPGNAHDLLAAIKKRVVNYYQAEMQSLLEEETEQAKRDGLEDYKGGVDQHE